MSDPMQNLNRAATALNQVAERAAAFWDDADQQIAARRGAYDALAEDLGDVVAGAMYFTAMIDPDDPNPSNVDGGSFATIKSAIMAAPAGASVILSLMADKSYNLDETVYVENKYVSFVKEGDGANPKICAKTYQNSSGNTSIYALWSRGRCAYKFNQIDIEIPTNMPAGAGDWGVMRAIIAYEVGGQVVVGLRRCNVSGGIAGASLGLMSCNGGSSANLSAWQSSFDGPIFGVVDVSEGVAIIAKSTVTLSNGAQLADGGVVGTSLLQN